MGYLIKLPRRAGYSLGHGQVQSGRDVHQHRAQRLTLDAVDWRHGGPDGLSITPS
jgi:hypothetical protein